MNFWNPTYVDNPDEVIQYQTLYQRLLINIITQFSELSTVSNTIFLDVFDQFIQTKPSRDSLQSRIADLKNSSEETPGYSHCEIVRKQLLGIKGPPNQFFSEYFIRESA